MPHLLSQRDNPGQQANENISEQTSLVSFIDDHHRVPTEHKVLWVVEVGGVKGRSKEQRQGEEE